MCAAQPVLLGASLADPLAELPDEIGFGLMKHCYNEFTYLSRFLPSLYYGEHGNDEKARCRGHNSGYPREPVTGFPQILFSVFRFTAEGGNGIADQRTQFAGHQDKISIKPLSKILAVDIFIFVF